MSLLPELINLKKGIVRIYRFVYIFSLAARCMPTHDTPVEKTWLPRLVPRQGSGFGHCPARYQPAVLRTYQTGMLELKITLVGL